jgi:hypothetical protein
MGKFAEWTKQEDFWAGQALVSALFDQIVIQLVL